MDPESIDLPMGRAVEVVNTWTWFTFVVDQDGDVWILDNDGELLETGGAPRFLDGSDLRNIERARDRVRNS